MTLSNQNVVIQNSQFINLSFFASAVFILQNSNVVFKNATFTGCQNAVAAAIFGNNSQVSLPSKAGCSSCQLSFTACRCVQSHC